VDATNPEQYKAKVVKNRRVAEDTTRNKLIGKASGLDEKTVNQLQNWEWLFNWEAHRGLLSLFMASKALLDSKGQHFSLGPSSNELNESMYLNHANELHWMVLRLIPFMRRTETPKDEEWDKKWKLLEDSYKFMMDGFAGLGKPIAPAIFDLMSSKFNFGVDTFYAEHKRP
jgi:hypothetical protein